VTVLRSFVLNSPDKAAELVAFIKQHAGSAVQAGQPLQVTVARFKPKRSDGSNKFYWAAVLQQISDQVRVDGQWFAPEVWGEHLKQRFLPEQCASGKEKWAHYPDGSRVLTMGTSDLNSEEMGLYLAASQAYAISDLSVVFDREQ
jgi:hypothetical protein